MEIELGVCQMGWDGMEWNGMEDLMNGWALAKMLE